MKCEERVQWLVIVSSLSLARSALCSLPLSLSVFSSLRNVTANGFVERDQSHLGSLKCNRRLNILFISCYIANSFIIISSHSHTHIHTHAHAATHLSSIYSGEM